MSVESLNQQNDFEKVEMEVDKKLEGVDAKGVDFEKTKIPSENTEISVNTERLMSFISEGSSLDLKNSPFFDQALENVVKEIFPGKTNIEMKDIYALSDTQKADLAWKVVSMQPLSEKQWVKNIRTEHGDIVALKSIEKALLSWVTIGTITSMPKNDMYTVRGVNANLSEYSISKSDFQMYSSLVSEYKNVALTDVFKSFYETWDKMPAIMPSTYALATWDLHTTTTWLWGIANLWRESFDYDFETKNTQNNGISFGFAKGPMNITVGAEWIDEIGWEITFVLADPQGKQYTIEWTYTSEGLVLRKDPMLKWVVVTWTMITLPKEYKDWDIQVQTKSNQYDNGTYDEIIFPLSIDNGRLWGLHIDVNDMNNLENNVNYKLWDYQASETQLMSIDTTINDIAYYGKRILSDTLPISLYAWVNDISIPDSDIGPRFLNNQELFEDSNYMVIKNDLQNWEIQNIRKEYQQKVDLMSAEEMGNPTWSGDQLNAQKLLTKLRFLTVLESMDKNHTVKKLLNEGKLDVSMDYKNEKASWLMVEPFDYIEKK